LVGSDSATVRQESIPHEIPLAPVEEKKEKIIFLPCPEKNMTSKEQPENSVLDSAEKDSEHRIELESHEETRTETNGETTKLNVTEKTSISSGAEVVDGNYIFDPKFNNLAVAVKTGKEVAAARVPIQMVTFLQRVQNVMIIGSEPRVSVGGMEVVDVYTGLYDRAPSMSRSQNGLALHNNSVGTTNKENSSSRNGIQHKSPPSPRAPTAPRLQRRTGTDHRLLDGEDAVVQDINSKGWQRDAHKNLPGFRKLVTKYPDADWYIMIDDDTYLFVDGLHAYLSTLKPTDMHYLGVANVFTGCDGIREFGKGPYFAHGGSGIVISKAAMTRMMRGLDNCIIKYKDCWVCVLFDQFLAY
jgi:hypothetical protein